MARRAASLSTPMWYVWTQANYDTSGMPGTDYANHPGVVPVCRGFINGSSGTNAAGAAAQATLVTDYMDTAGLQAGNGYVSANVGGAISIQNYGSQNAPEAIRLANKAADLLSGAAWTDATHNGFITPYRANGTAALKAFTDLFIAALNTAGIGTTYCVPEVLILDEETMVGFDLALKHSGTHPGFWTPAKADARFTTEDVCNYGTVGSPDLRNWSEINAGFTGISAAPSYNDSNLFSVGENLTFTNWYTSRGFEASSYALFKAICEPFIAEYGVQTSNYDYLLADEANPALFNFVSDGYMDIAYAQRKNWFTWGSPVCYGRGSGGSLWTRNPGETDSDFWRRTALEQALRATTDAYQTQIVPWLPFPTQTQDIGTTASPNVYTITEDDVIWLCKRLIDNGIYRFIQFQSTTTAAVWESLYRVVTEATSHAQAVWGSGSDPDGRSGRDGRNARNDR